VRVLKEVYLIACEDTRRTIILLEHYQITKPLISYHQHSKLQKVDHIIALLKSGQNVGLVTDAGTPGVSDPGGVLIAEAIKNKIGIEPIPGPSAITTILAVSGIAAEKFLFLGYFPKKKGRQTLLGSLKTFPYPIVIFESPYRIQKTLEDIQKSLGDRQIIVGRELTKKFEEILRGKISEVLPKIREQGEFVIIINNE
jgi:16S rRNA (cytidine1402-2'-O)-methyltransferase